MNLTIRELRNLEGGPKSHLRRVLDRGLSALPFIIAALLILVYKFAPNYGKYAANKIAYPISDAYTVFTGAIGVVMLACFIMGYFSVRAYEKLLFKAPLYCAALLILGAYDIATLKTGALPLPYFPWIDRILLAIIEDRKILVDCVAHSLVLLFSGYATGTLAGLATGIGAGWSPRVRYWIMPLMRILGPIPSTTWISIILIVASSLFGGSVFMIALGVWYPVAMSAFNGVSNVDKSNFEVARTFGVKNVMLVFKVAIPAALPSIFNGLTQGMSIACTALMVAEMLGVESGLGWYINWQRGWAEFAKMYAAVIIICLTFTAVNFALTLIKKRALRWREMKQ
jgi:NitT/TauT family transport system permease protein